MSNKPDLNILWEAINDLKLAGKTAKKGGLTEEDEEFSIRASAIADYRRIIITKSLGKNTGETRSE